LLVGRKVAFLGPFFSSLALRMYLFRSFADIFGRGTAIWGLRANALFSFFHVSSCFLPPPYALSSGRELLFLKKSPQCAFFGLASFFFSLFKGAGFSNFRKVRRFFLKSFLGFFFCPLGHPRGEVTGDTALLMFFWGSSFRSPSFSVMGESDLFTILGNNQGLFPPLLIGPRRDLPFSV